MSTLAAIGENLALANPNRPRVIAESTKKTDRLDAPVLAGFLARDMTASPYMSTSASRLVPSPPELLSPGLFATAPVITISSLVLGFKVLPQVVAVESTPRLVQAVPVVRSIANQATA
jgi:hypothetical protein